MSIIKIPHVPSTTVNYWNGGIAMKYYTLTAIVGGRNVKLRRNIFATRSDAINYMFDYYEKNNLFSLEVRDEYPVDGDKHKIEYVCNYQNRFIVARS